MRVLVLVRCVGVSAARLVQAGLAWASYLRSRVVRVQSFCPMRTCTCARLCMHACVRVCVRACVCLGVRNRCTCFVATTKRKK